MKTKLFYTLVLGAVILCSFTSCKQKQDTKLGADRELETGSDIVTEKQETQDSLTVATGENEKENVSYADEKLNDAACFIAGLPVSNTEGKLYALTQTAEWQSHARNMNQIWNSFLQINPKASAFSQTELSDINQKSHTLFYPFGGPDFLFSNTFFPDMDTYFLIGLERAGNAVEVKHPSVDTYHLYQNAVSDILNLSFFRTKDMKNELSNDTIDGVVPIITLLMERAGREIVSLESKRLDKDGTIVSVKEDGSPIVRSNLAEIKFMKRGSDKVQTLYYLSADLSNGGFLQNKALQAYVAKLDKTTTTTFIKSASYLLHSRYFSGIRDAILEHSSAIVQDDSGIPWSSYDESKWDMSLYGTFTKPISLFAKYPQLDLRDVYQTRETEPLNFRIGYARQSNIQIARLK